MSAAVVNMSARRHVQRVVVPRRCDHTRRSRANDVPDAHPEPEQRLERLVPSVSPVGSRHGLSADFVARSLRTRSDLAAGDRCAVLLTSLPFQRAIARPLGPRRWQTAGASWFPGRRPHIQDACLEPSGRRAPRALPRGARPLKEESHVPSSDAQAVLCA